MPVDQAAELAIRILDLRQRRRDHLPPDIFAEHAWGLLLVLFIADAAGEPITADEACKRAGSPIPLGRNWLAVLEKEDLLACVGICEDGHTVALTPVGTHAVENCMQDAERVLAIRG